MAVNVYEPQIDAPDELYVVLEGPTNWPQKVHQCEKLVWSLIVFAKQPTNMTPGLESYDGVLPSNHPDYPPGGYSFTVTIDYEQAQ